METILNKLSISSIRVSDAMSRYTDVEVVDVKVFIQVWPNTSLGFSGCGGDCMTPAWTHVVQTDDNKYHIFFNGKYAYTVENPTDVFINDLSNHSMKCVDEAQKKY